MEALGIVGSLAGVVLGFALGEGARRCRERREEQNRRQAIESELSANLAMISQRRDVLSKMRQATLKSLVLPGQSVRFVSLAYEQFGGSCLLGFSAVARDNLHVMYEHFRCVDSFMLGYEENLIRAVGQELMLEPFVVFRHYIEDDLRILDKLEKELIPRFLAGNPVDVFYRDKKPKPQGYV